MEEVHQELKVRTRVLTIYNKRREDFASKEEYDAYLEEIEDIIYNLANKVDLRETEAKVEAYSRSNRIQIQLNQARQVEEQLVKVRQAVDVAAAGTAPSSAADAATPASAAGNGGGYIPEIAAMAMLPRPIEQVSQDAEGNLVLRPLPPLSRAALQAAAAASGWTSDLPRKRAWQEAFTTIFVF